MRIVLQRVTEASVTVEGNVSGRIGLGYMLLVGFSKDDTAAVLQKAVDKVIALRLFPEGEQQFHLPLEAVGGAILAVPQFTLYADATKGRRPDLFRAQSPGPAEELFEKFVDLLRANFRGPVATGIFQAHMEVRLLNDGPVTILLEF